MTKLTTAEIRDAIASSNRQAVRDAISAAEALAPELRKVATESAAASIDPTLSDNEAQATRKDADDAAFAADRMDAALQALTKRLAALEAAEAEAERSAQYETAQTLVTKAQARFAKEWDAALLVVAGMVLEMDKAIAAASVADDDLPAGKARVSIPLDLRELRSQSRRLKMRDGRNLLTPQYLHNEPGAVPADELERLIAAKGRAA